MEQRFSNLEKQLDRLSFQLDGLHEKIDTQVECAQKSLDRVSKTLYGETGANGLSGKVRSLEDGEFRRRNHIKMVWTAMVAMGAAIFKTHS